MKTTLLILAAVAAYCLLIVPFNANRDDLYRMAASSPTPTPRPSTPHAHKIIRFPELPTPELDRVLNQVDKSDPEMIAALQAGSLDQFEIDHGNPPVTWRDNPRTK